MSSKTPIFFIGATGYIGGSVLSRLLSHPNANTFAITAIVRSPEKARKIEAFGVKTVVASTNDTALVEKLAEEAHTVFSCADADDAGAIQAVLKGLRNRHAKLGDLPILIHTSGTGVLTKGFETKGMYATDKIYYDDDPASMASIPDDAAHRNVDLLVVQADKEGYVKTYIVLPSTIWGIATNKLTEAGIANPYSVQIPMLIKASLPRGQAGVVGKGLALWPDVDIEEQADLYIILYDAIVTNPDKVGHGAEGYYFGIAGEHPWYDISKAIGEAMVKRGLSKTAEPTAFTSDDFVKYFGSEAVGDHFGTNSRGVANHSKSLGWNPKLSSEDMLASIDAEVEAILNQQKE